VTRIDGGWLNHNWIQLAKQLADSVAGFSYSFGGSCLILFIMNLIPGLSLRASEEAEVLGMDDAEIGEFAVSSSTAWKVDMTNGDKYDYVELTRDVVNGDALDEAGSKYSGGRGSPLEPHEKTFSSSADEESKAQ
jgi:ammonium transporter, Amt family